MKPNTLASFAVGIGGLIAVFYLSVFDWKAAVETTKVSDLHFEVFKMALSAMIVGGALFLFQEYQKKQKYDSAEQEEEMKTRFEEKRVKRQQANDNFRWRVNTANEAVSEIESHIRNFETSKIEFSHELTKIPKTKFYRVSYSTFRKTLMQLTQMIIAFNPFVDPGAPEKLSFDFREAEERCMLILIKTALL